MILVWPVFGSSLKYTGTQGGPHKWLRWKYSHFAKYGKARHNCLPSGQQSSRRGGEEKQQLRCC